MYLAFEKQLEKFGLLNTNKKVVLAISGGVDSMVLLNLFQRIPKDQRPIVFIAHVNHELRLESKYEETFVRSMAERQRVPIFVHHWEQSKHPETGTEEAARNVRYTFFKEVMRQTKADALITAHHQDDQVETILMKLTRGSSLEQITGIENIQPFHQAYLIRPLLPFSKDDIYHYSEAENIDYMEDQSNKELTYSRNRFRNLIIPLLKEENIKFNEHIEQFAVDLQDLISIAEEPIRAAFTKLVTIHRDHIKFSLERYQQFTHSMQRAVLVEIMNTIYEDSSNRYKVSYIAIIQDWLKKAEGNSQLHLTEEISVYKTYDQISFQKRGSNSSTPDTATNQSSFIIKEPNELIQLSSTESIKLEIIDSLSLASEGVHQNERTDQLVFHSDQVEFPLIIRHRQPGDRMTYKGLKGTKKIKDIFIDEKVPAIDRDKAWVVEDATGTIIWLISYRKMYLLTEIETDKLTYILNYNKH